MAKQKKKKSRRRRKNAAQAAPKHVPKRRRRRNAGKKHAHQKHAAPKRRRRRVMRANPASKPKKPAKKGGKKKSTLLLRAMKSKARGRTKRTATSAIKRIKKLRPAERRRAEALGFLKSSRKNPGGIMDFLKQEANDFMALAPDIAVQLGSLAAIGYVGGMASESIKKMVRGVGADGKTPKDEPKDSFLYNYAGVLSSGALTLAAFAGMKMSKSEKVNSFSLPVLMGGMAATIVQLLAAVKVSKPADEKAGTAAREISLGQHLGLPIGEFVGVSGFGDYMSMNGFVDVHGRSVAVDGMGDYIPQALGALNIGQSIEGSTVSMGDYVEQSLSGYDFQRTIEGTVLGEIGQMSEGRQGSRALGAPGDQTVESFVDSGVLSGSVFD